jgi:hypothetical protein
MSIKCQAKNPAACRYHGNENQITPLSHERNATRRVTKARESLKSLAESKGVEFRDIGHHTSPRDKENYIPELAKSQGNYYDQLVELEYLQEQRGVEIQSALFGLIEDAYPERTHDFHRQVAFLTGARYHTQENEYGTDEVAIQGFKDRTGFAPREAFSQLLNADVKTNMRDLDAAYIQLVTEVKPSEETLDRFEAERNKRIFNTPSFDESKTTFELISETIVAPQARVAA